MIVLKDNCKEAFNSKEPKVIAFGKASSGKTSLCKALAYKEANTRDDITILLVSENKEDAMRTFFSFCHEYEKDFENEDPKKWAEVDKISMSVRFSNSSSVFFVTSWEYYLLDGIKPEVLILDDVDTYKTSYFNNWKDYKAERCIYTVDIERWPESNFSDWYFKTHDFKEYCLNKDPLKENEPLKNDNTKDDEPSKFDYLESMVKSVDIKLDNVLNALKEIRTEVKKRDFKNNEPSLPQFFFGL